MACTLSTGLSASCKGSAGIYELYLATRPATTLTVTHNTDGKVTDVDDTATPLQFYKFDFLGKTLAYKENRLVENGAIGFEKTLEGTITNMSQEAKDALEPIEQGETIAVIKAKSGKYFLIGEFEALEIAPGEDGIGANITDLNGYLLTLMCQEGERSNEVVAITTDSDGCTITSV